MAARKKKRSAFNLDNTLPPGPDHCRQKYAAYAKGRVSEKHLSSKRKMIQSTVGMLSGGEKKPLSFEQIRDAGKEGVIDGVSHRRTIQAAENAGKAL